MKRNCCQQRQANPLIFLGIGLAFVGVGLSGQSTFLWLGAGLIVMSLVRWLVDRRAGR